MRASILFTALSIVAVTATPHVARQESSSAPASSASSTASSSASSASATSSAPSAASSAPASQASGVDSNGLPESCSFICTPVWRTSSDCAAAKPDDRYCTDQGKEFCSKADGEYQKCLKCAKEAKPANSTSTSFDEGIAKLESLCKDGKVTWAVNNGTGNGTNPDGKKDSGAETARLLSGGMVVSAVLGGAVYALL